MALVLDCVTPDLAAGRATLERWIVALCARATSVRFEWMDASGAFDAMDIPAAQGAGAARGAIDKVAEGTAVSLTVFTGNGWCSVDARSPPQASMLLTLEADLAVEEYRTCKREDHQLVSLSDGDGPELDADAAPWSWFLLVVAAVRRDDGGWDERLGELGHRPAYSSLVSVLRAS